MKDIGLSSLKMIGLFKKNISLVDYIIEYSKSTRRPAAYKRRLRRLAKLLVTFEEHVGIKLHPCSFDDELSEKLIHFIKASKPIGKSKAYKSDTIRRFVEQIRMILARLERRGEKVRLEALKELSIPKDESAAVYLSMQEIERINALYLHKDSAQVRDIFIVGCLTGLRYSDYSRLSEDNFVNSNIDILTKKTNTRVVIPVHPLIDDLIARNNGYGFLRYNKSQQNFNMRIKYICKKAGIDEKVHYECTEGFRRVKHTKRKYELISSHTARRSCATNMYLSGIPTARIMLITGHKTESAFFAYIRIRKEENAEELRAHPFFSR